MAAWVASVLCLYVVGLSCLAKVESEPGLVRFWPCLLLGAPVLLAMFVNPGGEDRKDALLVSAILGLWVLRCLQHTFWAEKRDIGKTVGGLLAGLCWWICWRYSMWLRRWRRCFSDFSFWLWLHSAGCRRHKKTGNGFPFPVVIQCVRLRVEGSTFEGEFSHAGLV